MLDYDREAAHYDAARGGDARADAAADAIETLLPLAAGSVARIVDAGCGTGIVTVRLLRAGRSVAGIDCSAGMAAVAAGRLLLRLAAIEAEDFHRLFPHLHLPDLAGHRHRELVDDMHVPGDLVMGELPGTE